MAYLVLWDSWCCGAGSIVSDGLPTEEVIPTRRAAIRRVKYHFVRMREYAADEVRLILANPDDYEFDADYYYGALAVGLPRGTRSVEAASAWVQQRVDDGRCSTLTVVAHASGTMVSPFGLERTSSEAECLERLLGC